MAPSPFKTLLALSLLWPLGLSPLQSTAGELTDVSDGPRLQLSLPDLDGRQHNLDEFIGKVVLIDFWASWCMPCIEEMPRIKRLAEQMRDHPFTVIGINVGEAERRVRATVNRLGVDFTVLLDKDSEVFRAWGANVLPTAYVFDREGRVRYIARGPIRWDETEMTDRLLALIETEPPSE